MPRHSVMCSALIKLRAKYDIVTQLECTSVEMSCWSGEICYFARLCLYEQPIRLFLPSCQIEDTAQARHCQDLACSRQDLRARELCSDSVRKACQACGLFPVASVPWPGSMKSDSGNAPSDDCFFIEQGNILITLSVLTGLLQTFCQ